ncbi:MAG: hypothetical protein RL033_7708 [Pseudomonadota bacterium]
MTLRLPCGGAVALGLGLLVSLLAPSALAGDVVAAPVLAEPVLAAPPADSHEPARILERLALEARSERVTRAWLSLGSGAGLTTAGLLDEADGDAGFGRVIWIAGLLSITGGVLTLFVASPLERLEHDAGRRSVGYSPGALERAWHEQAEDTRSARKIISVVNFVIGGAGFAASGALAAGWGGWSERTRERWAVELFAGGTLFTSAGIAQLLIRSDVEEAYDLAYPASAGSGLQLHFAPAHGGATLQLCGQF